MPGEPEGQAASAVGVARQQMQNSSTHQSQLQPQGTPADLEPAAAIAGLQRITVAAAPTKNR
jgi:hypothetical protein